MVGVYKPKTIKEALEILEFEDCIVFAGGTDLMVKKKQWSGLTPSFDKAVMFISEIPELTRLYQDEKYLYIGAACTLSQLIDSELIPGFYKKVFAEMASPGIRNAATLGGNICNASPAADCLPLLYALDAVLIIENSCRKMEVPIEDFIVGPGQTILHTGDLVTAIRIPNRSFTIAEYKKVGSRKSTALSKLSFIGLVSLDNEGLQDIRITFGAVAPTVVRNRDLEGEILSMYSAGFIDMHEINSYYSILIKPIDDQRSTVAYRKAVCLRLLADFIRNKML